MDELISCLEKSVDVDRQSLYVFSTKTSPGLISYLQDDYNFEVLLRKLTLTEQVRIRSLKDAVARVKALVSKLFVRIILNYFVSKYDAQRCPDLWADIPFQYNSYGKPTLSHNFTFSISTSDHVISVAVQTKSQRDIGIDLSHKVQHGISSVDFMDQFRPIFSSTEAVMLNHIADDFRRYTAFNQLWTFKEAFTKLIGTGLNIDLASFSFDLKPCAVSEEDPILDEVGLLEKTCIKWKDDTTIDIHNLNLSDISGVPSLTSDCLYCYTGVMERGKERELPVFVSIITQHPFKEPKAFCINFAKLLEMSESRGTQID